jgi:hypothetical protein
MKCINKTWPELDQVMKLWLMLSPPKPWSGDNDLLVSLRDYFAGLLAQFWFSLG